MSRKRNDKPKRITAKHVQAEDTRPLQLPTVEAKPEVDDHEDCQTDGLNTRRRMFVEYITGPAMGNASRAAALAGYAAENNNALRATASYLLTIPNVQKAIARKLAAMRMDAAAIEQDIATLAGADMSNFIKVVDGKPEFDWEAASAAGAIGQVKEYTEEGFDAAGGKVTIIKRKFKIHDRLRALELMARIKGMLIERHQHTGEVKFGQMTFDGDKQIAS